MTDQPNDIAAECEKRLDGYRGLIFKDRDASNLNCLKADLRRYAAHMRRQQGEIDRLRDFCRAVCPSNDTAIAYDKSMGEMYATLQAKDRSRMARRIVKLETALQDVRPYIGHHERCPGWGNNQGASCNCGGQDGYAIIDEAVKPDDTPQCRHGVPMDKTCRDCTPINHDIGRRARQG